MSVTLRPGKLVDSPAVFGVFRAAMLDLGRRSGTMPVTGGDDPAVMASLWERRRPLFEHLARTADHFWVAEREGEVVGYARSILRDGVRELTEFFVLADVQSAGLGRDLLSRAFPSEGARHRVIVASTDMRALARYLKAGIYPRITDYFFSRTPEPVSVNSDLVIETMPTTPETLEALATLDRTVLGHRRDVDHIFLQTIRPGYVYRRGSEVVGYGYLGPNPGPFAVLDAQDFPAILAHAESECAAQGWAFGVDAPGSNQAAIAHLLARGCQIDPFYTLIMTDGSWGRFENYLLTNPAFFL